MSLLDQDDVFRPKFLTDLVFGGVAAGDITLAEDLEPLLLRWQVYRIAYEPHLDVPDGQYYFTNNVLHSVWRVYLDPQLAFVQALWRNVDEQGGFVQVHAPGNGYRGHGIAVPSRAYGHPQQAGAAPELQPGSATSTTMASVPGSYSESSSLNGWRVAVKDNYHICGTKTSLDNRAYYDMSPISQFTAEAVSRLAGAGAHIVGKTHLSSFAMMEHQMLSDITVTSPIEDDADESETFVTAPPTRITGSLLEWWPYYINEGINAIESDGVESLHMA